MRRRLRRLPVPVQMKSKEMQEIEIKEKRDP
jgi:hypothetical protein